MRKRIIYLLILLCLVFCLPVNTLWAEDTDEQTLSMLQGYEAFRNEDWVSALFFLRKAVGYGAASEEAWYLLILSEMYSQEYASAIQDCQYYMTHYPEGEFYPLVEYQYGRALYSSGRYQDAISQFSDFCHTYPESAFYPSAIFYIAESFFNEYNYASAKVLYQRLVDEFPLGERTPEAEERLLAISQAEREEKLLYLLRVTGEEYLAAKEDYEKQLRKYQSEDSMGLQDQLSKSFSDIQEMRATVDVLQGQNAAQARRIAELEDENERLQISAGEARRIAADIATAGAIASEEKAEEPVPTEKSGYSDVVLEEGVLGTITRYPELEALREKADELQRLLEERSLGGEK
ncbi:MAG: outer membrane protein assembly factor BamD [Spirochaetaceae bacterium]|nr:outer membrane protein assembly factor BamD [Spirochaetaceae bacterium]